MPRIIALLIAVTMLGGCAIYTPKGSVVVDPGGAGGRSGGDGKFCPPGQAKKGNC